LDFVGTPPKLPSPMARLAQLLASHSRILVLDAASLRVQVGLLRAGQPALWAESDDEAGRGLFRAAETLLTQTTTDLTAIEAFIFCEGPGSMLGTRTVAMTLRTWNALQWRPVFRYQSLALAGVAEWQRSHRGLSVIADARRESWHVQTITAGGELRPLERRPTADLPGGELLTPAGFRVWSKSPAHVTECSYTLAHLLDAAGEADLFQVADDPDAFQHDAPTYTKWSAQPHSAETAKPR
jgi:tRNA threonylcarbamoyladenosine biosynthesis protein TsaB